MSEVNVIGHLINGEMVNDDVRTQAVSVSYTHLTLPTTPYV